MRTVVHSTACLTATFKVNVSILTEKAHAQATKILQHQLARSAFRFVLVFKETLRLLLSLCDGDVSVSQEHWSMSLASLREQESPQTPRRDVRLSSHK